MNLIVILFYKLPKFLLAKKDYKSTKHIYVLNGIEAFLVTIDSLAGALSKKPFYKLLALGAMISGIYVTATRVSPFHELLYSPMTSDAIFMLGLRNTIQPFVNAGNTIYKKLILNNIDRFL